MPIWDTQTGKPALNLVTEPGAGFEAGGAAWSSDGRYLALVLGGTIKKVQFSRVQVWDMQTRQPVFQHSLQGNNYFASVTWQPGTNHLAVAADLQTGSAIQLWNIVTGKLLTSSPTSPGFMPGSLSWSPDGQDIVYGSYMGGRDSSLVVLNVTTGQRLYTFHPGSGAVSYVNGNWSPDGKYIASLEVRLPETMGQTVVLQVWIA